MDPPIISEASFLAGNPCSYTLAEIWPFSTINGNEPCAGGEGGLGLRMGSFAAFGELNRGDMSSSLQQEESTVTSGSRCGDGARKRREANSEDESSYKIVSTSAGNDLSNLRDKRVKLLGSKDEIGNSKVEMETSCGSGSKPLEQNSKPSEPLKDYIHVRARRGQATDSHSLAERARREKISERMKILQDLVPGCNKVIGKALVLDEIINYIQSLQHQVEFLSMKLETVNTRMNPAVEGFPTKDLGPPSFDQAGMIYGAQEAARDYGQQGSQPEWLHMQLGNSFERAT